MDSIFFRQFGAAEEAAESGLAVLGINPLAFLLQLVTFLILFLLLKRFAFAKIVSLLEERRRTIDKGVDLGLAMEAQKQQLDKKVDEILHKARADADKIIAGGHHEAGVIIKEAEAAAARKTDAMLADAHAKIGEDIERARRELEKEMASLVAEATEAIIDEKLDARKDSDLISRALRKVKA
jgi:F-type H+-transporting ATPase subunit b